MEKNTDRRAVVDHYIHVQKLQQYLYYYTVPSNQKLLVNHNNTRFKTDKERHTGRFGTPEEEKRAGGRREADAGGSVLLTLLWGMLYADDTGVVSQSAKPSS